MLSSISGLPTASPRSCGGTAWPPNNATPKLSSILGAMYDEGEGVAKDDVEAARWYRMSFVQQRRAVAAQFAFPSAKADSCGAYSGAK